MAKWALVFVVAITRACVSAVCECDGDFGTIIRTSEIVFFGRVDAETKVSPALAEGSRRSFGDVVAVTGLSLVTPIKGCIGHQTELHAQLDLGPCAGELPPPGRTYLFTGNHEKDPQKVPMFADVAVVQMSKCHVALPASGLTETQLQILADEEDEADCSFCRETPVVPHGQFDHCELVKPFGFCKLKCDKGYAATHAGVVCRGGQFIDIPACSAVDTDEDQPPLPLAWEVASTSEHSPQEEEAEEEQQQPQSWCEGAPPNPTGGRYGDCGTVSDGQVCVLNCDDGSYKTDDAVCSNGQYSHPLPQCHASPCFARDLPGAHMDAQILSLSDPRALVGEGEADTEGRTWVGGEEEVVGRFACSLVRSGSVCPLICPDGFMASTPHAICDRGQFTSVPACIRLTAAEGTAVAMAPTSCTQPPDPAVGHFIECEEVPSGGVCRFFCPQGYHSTSEGALCSNGRYEDTPACVILSGCPPPPPPPEGGYYPGQACAGFSGQVGEGVPSGTECDLQCHGGYTSWGPPLRCTDGAWSAPAPTCVPLPCMGPPTHATPGGSFADCSHVRSGDICPLSCELGYEAQEAGARCAWGAYLNKPVCKESACRPPTSVQGGQWICQGLAAGGVCQLACDDGYTPSSATEPVAVCSEGQWRASAPRGGVDVWTPLPTCLPSPCKGVPQDPSVKFDSCTELASGSVCWGSCPGGVRVSALCSFGKYEAVECPKQSCYGEPTAVVGGSFLPVLSTPHGAVRPLACHVGYTKEGPDAVCDNGRFTEAPTCVPNPCRGLPPDSYSGGGGGGGTDVNPSLLYVGGCAYVPSGGQCVLTCPPGQRKEGWDADCFAGKYSDDRAWCVVDQPSSSSSENEKTGFLWKVDIAAPAERGDALRCGGPPTLYPPLHGVWPECDVPDGGRCDVLCDDGFNAAGLGVECVAGSYVLSALPTCVPAPVPHCVRPSQDPPGGFFDCEVVWDGLSCPLVCLDGFIKFGTDAMCLQGEYSGDHPQCLPEQRDGACVGPPQREAVGGAWRPCLYVASGAVCDLDCYDGFRPKYGLTSAVCMEGRYSSSPLPQCEPDPAQPVGGPDSCSGPPSTRMFEGGRFGVCEAVEHGRICPLNCYQGFRKVGMEALCDGGRYRSMPMCVEEAETLQDCYGPPDGSVDGYQACERVAHGDTCPLLCAAGHRQVGRDARCVDGRYVSLPSCIPEESPHVVPCRGPPGPDPEGGVWSACFQVAEGEACLLSCAAGYKQDGANAICDGGRYLASPICVALPAPLAVVVNAPCDGSPAEWVPGGKFAKCSRVAHGGVCPLACYDGHRKIGEDPRCVDGAWSSVPHCNREGTAVAEGAACQGPPGPDPEGGVFAPCFHVEEGEVCRLECHSGYEMSGEAAKCVRGRYHASPLCVRATTPGQRPNRDNADPVGSGVLKSAITNKSSPPDSGLGLACLGQPSRFVVGGGFADCGTLSNGGSCPLSCFAGYRPDGRKAKCSNGRYRDVPCCLPIVSFVNVVITYNAPPVSTRCEVLPFQDEHGYVEGGEFSRCRSAGTGDVCALSCYEGYQQTGPDTVCKADGSWSTVPRCTLDPRRSIPLVVTHEGCHCQEETFEEGKWDHRLCGKGQLEAASASTWCTTKGVCRGKTWDYCTREGAPSAAVVVVSSQGCTCKPVSREDGRVSHQGCGRAESDVSGRATWCETVESDCNNWQGWDFCTQETAGAWLLYGPEQSTWQTGRQDAVGTSQREQDQWRMEQQAEAQRQQQVWMREQELAWERTQIETKQLLERQQEQLEWERQQEQLEWERQREQLEWEMERERLDRELELQQEEDRRWREEQLWLREREMLELELQQQEDSRLREEAVWQRDELLRTEQWQRESERVQVHAYQSSSTSSKTSKSSHMSKFGGKQGFSDSHDSRDSRASRDSRDSRDFRDSSHDSRDSGRGGGGSQAFRDSSHSLRGKSTTSSYSSSSSSSSSSKSTSTSSSSSKSTSTSSSSSGYG